MVKPHRFSNCKKLWVCFTYNCSLNRLTCTRLNGLKLREQCTGTWWDISGSYVLQALDYRRLATTVLQIIQSMHSYGMRHQYPMILHACLPLQFTRYGLISRPITYWGGGAQQPILKMVSNDFSIYAV